MLSGNARRCHQKRGWMMSEWARDVNVSGLTGKWGPWAGLHAQPDWNVRRLIRRLAVSHPLTSSNAFCVVTGRANAFNAYQRPS